MNDAEIESALNACVDEIRRKLVATRLYVISNVTGGANLTPWGMAWDSAAYQTSAKNSLAPVGAFLSLAPWLIDGCMGRKNWPEDSNTVNRSGALEAFKGAANAAASQLELVQANAGPFPRTRELAAIVLATSVAIVDKLAGAAKSTTDILPWIVVGVVALVILYLLVALRPPRLSA